MDPHTAESLAFWAQDRPGKAAHYWASAAEPWRQDLLDALAPVAPFSSIFEVGCNSGPNYRRLRETFGAFPYTGLDVCGSALVAAVHYAKRDQIPGEAHWILGSLLTDATAWASRSFDLVFASSILSVIAPADLAAALGEMLRLSARVVAIQEPAEAQHDQAFHQWAHDYREELRAIDRGQWTWTAGPIWVGVRTLIPE